MISVEVLRQRRDAVAPGSNEARGAAPETCGEVGCLNLQSAHEKRTRERRATSTATAETSPMECGAPQTRLAAFARTDCEHPECPRKEARRTNSGARSHLRYASTVRAKHTAQQRRSTPRLESRTPRKDDSRRRAGRRISNHVRALRRCVHVGKPLCGLEPSKIGFKTGKNGKNC